MGIPDDNNELTVSYTTLVRRAMRFGGCSSSRSIFVGACAAALESKHPPEDWMARFDGEKRSEMIATSDLLASFVFGRN